MLSSEDLQKILPQRYPFLMIDKVEELEPNQKIVAIKNVSFNEGFFAGHFPDKPILPGVLIIESMAQAAIVLFASAKTDVPAKDQAYYLGSVKARFLQPVTPGDQLKITVEPIKVVSAAALVKAQAQVQDKEVAHAELSFSIK